MKIAIVNLTGGGLSGGYAKYLRELVPVLLRAGVERADVFVHPAVYSNVAETLPNVRTWPRLDDRLGYRSLRAELRGLAPDVLFFPTARRLSIGTTPTVVMVRNMEPLAMPFVGLVPIESARNVARWAVAWDACRRATRVIAVSDYVRDFVVSAFRVAPSKVGVVHHGVEPAPSFEAALRPSSLPASLDEFIFTAGSIRPARGLEDAVGALGVLRSRGVRIPLVVAGTVGPSMGHYFDRLDRQAQRLNVRDDIFWAGHLTPRQMSWCLLRCRAFVMTSRVEACPNMVLESMSHGCLSVSCDAPPMPDFFRDAAIYYPRGDAVALADRIEAVSSLSPAEQQRLREAGRRRASSFTWSETATRTLDQLRLAAERRFQP